MLDSLQSLTYAITSVFFALSTISILIRTYTRAVIVKGFGWDDWCMTAIFLFNGGQLAILYYFLLNGAGLHIMTVVEKNQQWLVNLTYALFVEEIYYVWMHWIIKMALLLFYLRLANTKNFRRSVYGTMVLNTLVAISTWIIYCVQCMPLDAYFHPAAHPGVKCLDKKIQAFVPSAFNVFIDVLIVILPIRPLWQIQVSLRKRLMLISIVSLGAVVVLISSLRMIVLQEFQKGADITYTLGKLIIISSIEIDVAIIAANGPSMKAFWSRFISKTMKRESEYGGKSNKLSDFSRRRTAFSQASCQALGKVTMQDDSINDSETELRQKESAILVTSSIGVETSSIHGHDVGYGRHNSFGRGL